MKIILLCIFFFFLVTFAVFAIETLDSTKILFLQDDTDGTIRECQGIISAANSKELKPRAYYIMGLSLLKQSKPAEARQNFEIVLAEFKDSKLIDYAKAGIADSYFLGADYQRAFLEYEKILQEKPDIPFKNLLQFKLARCLAKLGRWQEAEDSFNKIKEQYPLSFEAKLSGDILNENLFYFTIQVGAFSQQNRADKLCSKLKQKGYDAFISPVTKDKKAYYRVRVGRFNSKEEAEAVAKKLKKEDYTVKIYP